MNVLFDFYGELLNDKQRTVLQLYYSEDFSLTEIAESAGSTKQAVSYLLRRSEKKLEKFETQLALADKEARRREILRRLSIRYSDDTDLLAGLRELEKIDE